MHDNEDLESIESTESEIITTGYSQYLRGLPHIVLTVLSSRLTTRREVSSVIPRT